MRTSKILAFLLIAITSFHTAQARKHRHIKKVRSTSSNFLFISDVHLDPRLRITELGDDAGRDVWYAFVDKVNQIMTSPDAPKFIIYTGDLPVHTSGHCNTLEGTSEDVHDTAIAAVLRRLRWMSEKYKTPVFYLPGNNDALAGDYMPFANAQGQTPLSLLPPAPMFFNPTSEPGKKQAKSAKLLAANPVKGYYAAQVKPGLRIIALNTVMYNVECWYNGQAADEAEQMVWLRKQLLDAQKTRNKVYIAMHIPPGNQYNSLPMWNTYGGIWQDTFLRITANYSTTIAGVLYGHTHMDEMRRLYAPGTDTVTEVAISCPGISAQHGNNPAFKVVTFDDASKELLNFTTHYTTLPVSLQQWQGGSYSFRSAFKCNTGTIYDGVKNMPFTDFANYVNSIYTAGNGPIDIVHINCEIDVKTEQ